jgi:hypothetical protein
MKKPDWVNAICVAYYDPETGLMHPHPILMQDNSFVWEGKLYNP